MMWGEIRDRVFLEFGGQTKASQMRKQKRKELKTALLTAGLTLEAEAEKLKQSRRPHEVDLGFDIGNVARQLEIIVTDKL